MSRGLAVGIFIWVVSIVIGVHVGKRKGRRKAAEWLTIFLGPVGLITVLRLPESREAKIAEVQWADSGRPGKREPAPEPTRSADATFSPLRLIIVVFALLAAAAVGFYFKSQANPGREPSSFGSHSPLYLNVFETKELNPSALKLRITSQTRSSLVNATFATRQESDNCDLNSTGLSCGDAQMA